MSQYSNSNNWQSQDIVNLLAKLADQPNGLENSLKLTMLLAPKSPLPQSEQQLSPEAAKRTRLIAIAMRVAREKNIEKPPYFKGMNDEDISRFIAQYSSSVSVN